MAPRVPMRVSLLNSAGQPTPMPSNWKSPMRADGKPKTLHQVVVETAKGPLRVGPAWDRVEAADSISAATAKAILDGKIHGWGMPQVIKIN